jgi:cyclase
MTMVAAPTSQTSLPRIIPCLLVDNGQLVKTVRFKAPKYIGDPMNAVRLFNEKGADELVFLDIGARRTGKEPDFDLIKQIGSQCFMPFAYGGGITTLEQVRRILGGGAEKVVLNTAALTTPELITAAAQQFGSQSVVVGVDVRPSWLGQLRVWDGRRGKLTRRDPVQHIQAMVGYGAGEVLLNDMARDGMRGGYATDFIRTVCAAVAVPVVACGGAGSVADLQTAIAAGASGAAAGSLFVLHGKHRAVLITYPSRDELDRLRPA